MRASLSYVAMAALKVCKTMKQNKHIIEGRIIMESKELKDFCTQHGITDVGDLSDGYHTFNDLYYQRCILFAALVNTFKDLSWKSHKHEDGEECFGGGWFIVGIDTPEGSYTYHYEDKYWDLFECQELEVGKMWDGHTEKDVRRLLSLSKKVADLDQIRVCEYYQPTEERRL